MLCGAAAITLPKERALQSTAAPTLPATPRCPAGSVLRQSGFDQIAACLRHNCRHPEDALKVLKLTVN